MVEHGPRVTKHDEEEAVHVPMPPEQEAIPAPRTAEHDSTDETTPNRHRRLGRNIIGILTGLTVLAGSAAFAMKLTRESRDTSEPPRGPETVASAPQTPGTSEVVTQPTAERSARTYKFDANTRLFFANNVQSFLEAQSKFDVHRGTAPSERLAVEQFPALLQMAANANTNTTPQVMEMSRVDGKGITNKEDLADYNTADNGLLSALLMTTGIKPGSPTFELAAKHNKQNIEEGTFSQFTLKSGKLTVERIKRHGASELGETLEKEEFEVAGGPTLVGETQMWDYRGMDVQKQER